MSLDTKSFEELRDMEYRQRLVVNRLQSDLYAEVDPAEIQSLNDELMDAQDDLHAIEEALAEFEPVDDKPPEARGESTAPGRPYLGTPRSGEPEKQADGSRSLETTGVGVTIDGYMEHLPTAFYHLLNPAQNPLVVCTVFTDALDAKRLRVISYIEGYTATAVSTIEVKRNKPQTVRQLPTLFPRAVRGLTELTRATLNIQVEDLDTNRVLEHRTEAIWLLARTTAPRIVKDAVTGESIDFAPYLAAFITPNEPSVMEFQRTVVRRHHQKRLRGYSGDVESQVQAIYDALKSDLDIAYVHSIVNFNLEDGVRSQRIRLPRECIAGKMGNCIDATLLFASLLEGISLNPAIALVPGHAFVGWQVAPDEDEWQYLETTMLQDNSFQEALEVGTTRANNYRDRAERTENDAWFKQLVVSRLRTEEGITPME